MDFIDYCIYTKNFNAIENAQDYVNLVRNDDKLTKEQRKRKMKLSEKLSIAANLATLGYVGLRTANYIAAKLNGENDVDTNLTDIQDEDGGFI